MDTLGGRDAKGVDVDVVSHLGLKVTEGVELLRLGRVARRHMAVEWDLDLSRAFS